MSQEFMSHEFLPYGVKGPGLVSTSPARISSSFLQGAVRREGASSPIFPPPPLPLDTHSEEERRETKVEDKIKEGGDVGKVMGKVDGRE